MSKLLPVCLAASLVVTGFGTAYAAANWGDPTTHPAYLGKDYTGDPAGALESMRNGTPGHMGGQWPPPKDAGTDKPATKQHQKPRCC
jgi:hypothetical protein